MHDLIIERPAPYLTDIVDNAQERLGVFTAMAGNEPDIAIELRLSVSRTTFLILKLKGADHRVSKRWRAVALSRPHLWSFLPLPFFALPKEWDWIRALEERYKNTPLAVQYVGGLLPLFGATSEGGFSRWIRTTMHKWRAS